MSLYRFFHLGIVLYIAYIIASIGDANIYFRVYIFLFFIIILFVIPIIKESLINIIFGKFTNDQNKDDDINKRDYEIL